MTSWPPAHIYHVGSFGYAFGYYTHAHPHGHPDHAASDDPEARRLAHPPTWSHAHEHRWDDPEDHHHPIGGA
jgi:hypothetical protein